MSDFDPSRENIVHNEEEENEDLNYVNRVPLVTKDEWGGMNPSQKEMEMMKFQETPVDSVVLAYNTGMLPRTTKEECITAMQELQMRHMENGEPDICYNFMICGDGNVYEGRGWDFGHSDRLSYPMEYGETVAIGMFGDISPQPSEEEGLNEERPRVYRKTPLKKFITYAYEKDLIKHYDKIYNDYDHKVLGENEFYTREDRPLPSDLSEPDENEIQEAMNTSDYINDSYSDEDADDEDDGEPDMPEELETDLEHDNDELGSDEDLKDMTKEEEEVFRKRIYFDENQSHVSSDELYSGYQTCASFTMFSESDGGPKQPIKHIYNKRKK